MRASKRQSPKVDEVYLSCFYVSAKTARSAENSGRFSVVNGPGWYWSHDGWVEGPFPTKKAALYDRENA
jgi:hypothetical protein